MGAIGSYTNITVPDGEEEFVISDTNDSLATKNVTTETLTEDRSLSKSVAGGVDVALTNAESLYGQLTFSGAITANINVTIPDNRERIYTVYNNTSGSYTLTFKTVSGTGTLITQGQRVVVASDGTNVNWLDTEIPGVIKLWSGAISAIPTGYALCNGSNGTPDLRKMMVVGASTDAGGVGFDVDDTGGTKDWKDGVDTVAAHTHGTDSQGAHVHDLPSGEGSSGSAGLLMGNVSGSQNVDAISNGAHTHTTSSQSPTAADWVGKYYTLAYIMKL